MATERMYDLAFRYKKTKLWKKLCDREIFAIRLSDGEIGYCCVMGMGGQVNAIALYVGAEGFQSYRNIIWTPPLRITSEFDYQELLLSQNCLQCTFESKDTLRASGIAEVRAYAKAHGITLRGANAFPQFLKYRQNYHPWDIVTDTDKQRICEALETCLALSELLQTKHKSEIGLSEIVKTTKTLPLFEREGDHFPVTRTDVPPEIPVEYPAPKAANDINIARIKRLPKKSVLECEVIRLLEPVQECAGEAPYYPVILLAVDRATGLIFPPKAVTHFEEHPEKLLEAFEESIIERDACPKTIEANSERTFTLLQDLCKKTGIRLSMAKAELSALENAKDGLLSATFQGDEDWDEAQDAGIAKVFEILMSLSDDALRQMPKEMIRQMLQLADTGMVPAEVEARLRRVFRL